MFSLGTTVMTSGASDLFAQNPHLNPRTYLARHQSGDWGTVCDEDKAENDFSVENGYRILSAYDVEGETIWVITEADRSVTTILLPDEY